MTLNLTEENLFTGETTRILVDVPRLASIGVEAFLEQLLPGRKVEHVGRTDAKDVWSGRPVPGSLFFRAVHECFGRHCALTLRPEVLMHLIVNEVATTVKLNAESYRHLFTRSTNKETVEVRHDGLVLGDPKSPWHEAIALFDPALKKAVPPGIMEHLLPALSTATEETRAASLVAFMDAASPFYDYVVLTRCGIPEIRLMGEPGDYRKILAAASQLSEVFRTHLGRYFDHLLPVLATLASQAEGAPLDEAFWRSIYKYESHSGGDLFNGWSTAFVSYVQEEETNGIVQKPDDLYDWTDMSGGQFGGMKGLALGSVPSQVSTVPFVWDYLSEKKKMLFAGGVLAVEELDGSLMPSLSYAVLHDG